MSFDSLERYDLNFKQIRFAQVSEDKETTSMPAICYTPTKALSLSLALLSTFRVITYREVWRGSPLFSPLRDSWNIFAHHQKKKKMPFSQQPLSIAPVASYLSRLHIQGHRPSSSTHRSHISPGGTRGGGPEPTDQARKAKEQKTWSQEVYSLLRWQILRDLTDWLLVFFLKGWKKGGLLLNVGGLPSNTPVSLVVLASNPRVDLQLWPLHVSYLSSPSQDKE